MPEPEINNPEDENQSEEEEESGVLIEFPRDSVRLPEPYLPKPIGRIAEGHPLIRPLIWSIVIFLAVLLLIILAAVSGKMSAPPSDTGQGNNASAYSERGGITYADERLDGWYTDPSHQHFQALDGRRFTYVDSHESGESEVTGHWRLIE